MAINAPLTQHGMDVERLILLAKKATKLAAEVESSGLTRPEACSELKTLVRQIRPLLRRLEKRS